MISESSTDNDLLKKDCNTLKLCYNEITPEMKNAKSVN